MSGHYRPASETPFKWRSAGGPMMTRLKWYLNASSPHKKNIVRVSSDPLWQNILDQCMKFDMMKAFPGKNNLE